MYCQHQALSKGFWKSAPEVPPPLQKKEVHVWSSGLMPSKSALLGYWEILSEVEKDRSELFRFAKDRIAYVTAKGVLRKLLGHYLDVIPSTIQFEHNSFGKPFLAEAPHALQFNISHSGGIGLFGFAPDAEIGVDIEQVKSEIQVQKTAARFFSKNEADTILSLAKEDQVNAFFKCWTRKEAFIKGHGQGMSLPLDEFEVSVLDETLVELRRVAWDENEAKEWRLTSFDVAEGFVGAMACRTPVERVRYFEV